MKTKHIIASILSAVALSSCTGFFDVESEYVINADKHNINNATDTIYSMIGVLNRVQAIAERTVLLGEARGDLMDVTDKTSADLRSVAMFENLDDTANIYNTPRDYYAIINNCNYFIATVDTAQKNNRNEHLFQKEYVAMKAIRAWTYLQLAINYGKVPFYTQPVLSVEDADISKYPLYGIQDICDYFLTQDGLNEIANPQLFPYPQYGAIKGYDSRLFYIPMYIVLGELNLWGGHYMDAAKNYNMFLQTRTGANSSMPIGMSRVTWSSEKFSGIHDSWILPNFYSTTYNSGTIFAVPSDSIESEGYYFRLRDIFNTTAKNDYEASLTPSNRLVEISEDQTFCYYNSKENKVVYAPKGMEDHKTGDLRLKSAWSSIENMVNPKTNQRFTYQLIEKYPSGNIVLYRKNMVYYRMAEALNRAGYPQLAYEMLTSGLTNDTIAKRASEYYKSDSTLIVNTLNFPDNQYKVYNPEAPISGANTIGLHSIGSGDSQLNAYYTMPVGTLDDQINAVEDMILTDAALEFAFEGQRYYDLLRVALRRGDAKYLSDRIKARRGNGTDSGIKTDLTNMDNWFLKWK